MFDNQEELIEVYSDNGREVLIDNDSLTPEEDAFMQGYDEVVENTEAETDEDAIYDQAFKKKSRRSKKKESGFDEDEIEADVLMQ